MINFPPMIRLTPLYTGVSWAILQIILEAMI